MNSMQDQNLRVDTITEILSEKKREISTALKVCAHCTLCADSCFLYRSREQAPEYMPSHKFLSTLGVIYRKKGKVSFNELQDMRDTLWRRCVLCTRCYCPLGINIPGLISIGRRILRSQGIFHDYAGNEEQLPPLYFQEGADLGVHSGYTVDMR